MSTLVKISPELERAILAATKNPKVPAAELLRLAKVAKDEGADATAAALIARAKVILAAVSNPAVVGRVAAETSPIPGVDAETWEKFTATIKAGKAPDSEAKGRIGTYAMSIPRLADLGVVKAPHKVKGPKGYWEAEWLAGTTKEAFAGSTLEKDTFDRSMKDYTEIILPRYKKILGKRLVNAQYGDKIVTLSGLLAVAHVAGNKGLESWVKDKAVREKFPGTTRLFYMANGIF